MGSVVVAAARLQHGSVMGVEGIDLHVTMNALSLLRIYSEVLAHCLKLLALHVTFHAVLLCLADALHAILSSLSDAVLASIFP